MKINKIKSTIICIFAFAAILSGCSSADNAESSSQADDTQVTYNGVTNPPSDEPPKAHRVTATTTTAVVTTVPSQTEVVTSTSVISTTTGNAETTTTSVTEAAENDNISDSGIEFTVGNQNSWEQNGSTVYQYELNITNNSTQDLSDWTIQVPLSDSNAELLQGWSGEFSISGSVLTIKGVDFNSTLSPSAQTSVGFQIASSSPVNIGDSVLSANGYSISVT